MIEADGLPCVSDFLSSPEASDDGDPSDRQALLKDLVARLSQVTKSPVPPPDQTPDELKLQDPREQPVPTSNWDGDARGFAELPVQEPLMCTESGLTERAAMEGQQRSLMEACRLDPCTCPDSVACGSPKRRRVSFVNSPDTKNVCSLDDPLPLHALRGTAAEGPAMQARRLTSPCHDPPTNTETTIIDQELPQTNDLNLQFPEKPHSGQLAFPVGNRLSLTPGQATSPTELDSQQSFGNESPMDPHLVSVSVSRRADFAIGSRRASLSSREGLTEDSQEEELQSPVALSDVVPHQLLFEETPDSMRNDEEFRSPKSRTSLACSCCDDRELAEVWSQGRTHGTPPQAVTAETEMDASGQEFCSPASPVDSDHVSCASRSHHSFEKTSQDRINSPIIVDSLARKHPVTPPRIAELRSTSSPGSNALKTSQACAQKEIVPMRLRSPLTSSWRCPTRLRESPKPVEEPQVSLSPTCEDVLAQDLPVMWPDEAPVEKSSSAERWSAHAHGPRMSKTHVDSPQMWPKLLQDTVDVVAFAHCSCEDTKSEACREYLQSGERGTSQYSPHECRTDAEEYCALEASVLASGSQSPPPILDDSVQQRENHESSSKVPEEVSCMLDACGQQCSHVEEGSTAHSLQDLTSGAQETFVVPQHCTGTDKVLMLESTRVVRESGIVPTSPKRTLDAPSVGSEPKSAEHASDPSLGGFTGEDQVFEPPASVVTRQWSVHALGRHARRTSLSRSLEGDGVHVAGVFRHPSSNSENSEAAREQGQEGSSSNCEILERSCGAEQVELSGSRQQTDPLQDVGESAPPSVNVTGSCSPGAPASQATWVQEGSSSSSVATDCCILPGVAASGVAPALTATECCKSDEVEVPNEQFQEGSAWVTPDRCTRKLRVQMSASHGEPGPHNVAVDNSGITSVMEPCRHDSTDLREQLQESTFSLGTPERFRAVSMESGSQGECGHVEAKAHEGPSRVVATSGSAPAASRERVQEGPSSVCDTPDRCLRSENILVSASRGQSCLQEVVDFGVAPTVSVTQSCSSDGVEVARSKILEGSAFVTPERCTRSMRVQMSRSHREPGSHKVAVEKSGITSVIEPCKQDSADLREQLQEGSFSFVTPGSFDEVSMEMGSQRECGLVEAEAHAAPSRVVVTSGLAPAASTERVQEGSSSVCDTSDRCLCTENIQVSASGGQSCFQEVVDLGVAPLVSVTESCSSDEVEVARVQIQEGSAFVTPERSTRKLRVQMSGSHGEPGSHKVIVDRSGITSVTELCRHDSADLREHLQEGSSSLVNADVFRTSKMERGSQDEPCFLQAEVSAAPSHVVASCSLDLGTSPEQVPLPLNADGVSEVPLDTPSCLSPEQSDVVMPINRTLLDVGLPMSDHERVQESQVASPAAVQLAASAADRFPATDSLALCSGAPLSDAEQHAKCSPSLSDTSGQGSGQLVVTPLPTKRERKTRELTPAPLPGVADELSGTSKRRRRVSLVQLPVGAADLEDVGRPVRRRVRPLDHWLNERLVYERKKDSLLPTLTGIVVATLDPLPGGATRSRRHAIPILDPPSVSEMQMPRRRRESDPLPPPRGRRLSGAVTESGELSKPRRRRESDPQPPQRRRRVSDPVPVQDVVPRRRREPSRRCESVVPLEGPTPPLTESLPSACPQALAVVLLPTDEERHESTCFAAPTEAKHLDGIADKPACAPGSRETSGQPLVVIDPSEMPESEMTCAAGSLSSCRMSAGLQGERWISSEIIIPPRSWSVPERLRRDRAVLLSVFSAEAESLCLHLGEKKMPLSVGDQVLVDQCQYCLQNDSESESAKLKLVLMYL